MFDGVVGPLPLPPFPFGFVRESKGSIEGNEVQTTHSKIERRGILELDCSIYTSINYIDITIKYILSMPDILT
jgi:hypothetical protein